jgi:hypothetical protein
VAFARELGWMLGLVACGSVGDADRKPPLDTASEVACDPANGWDPFARGYLTTWCTPCHSESLIGADRAGAPVGVDLDSWAGASLWADRVAHRSLDDTMPPGGGPSEAERARIAEWVACGAPGSDAVSSDCGTAATRPGDLRVDAGFDAAAFCAEAGHVAGSVTISVDTVGPLETCLCGIGGDLVVAPGAVEVSLLAVAEVGGTVRVEGSDAARVVLPALGAIGGDLRVAENAGLAELQLPALQTVVGAVEIRSNAVLPLLGLPMLDRAASLLVTDNPAVQAVSINRLDAVDGDLSVARNAVLDAWVGTELLRTVGGTLEVCDNDGLTGLDTFTRLEAVDGDLRVEDNDGLRSIDGFYALLTVGGTLSVHANPRLEDVRGFPVLDSAGALVITDSGLEVLTAFEVLTTVHGDLVLTGNDGLLRLSAFDALTVLDGDLDLRDNDVLGSITGLNDLQTVGGDLWISGDRLVRIAGLERLSSVTGEFTLATLPRLREAPGLVELARVGGLRLQQTALVDLDDLRRLREVDGDLVLRSNPELETVRALEDVERIGGDLDIRLNPSLPAEDAERLGAALGSDVVAGDTVISDNG